MTIVVSFFVYTTCVGLDFFPFLNVLAIPLLIGVGADDVFILNDLWQQEKVKLEGHGGSGGRGERGKCEGRGGSGGSRGSEPSGEVSSVAVGSQEGTSSSSFGCSPNRVSGQNAGKQFKHLKKKIFVAMMQKLAIQ